jgi:hypothetical protein
MLVAMIGASILLWGGTGFRTSLSKEFPHRIERLVLLLGSLIQEVEVSVYEYDSVEEFTRVTGAPYWIRGFTNISGIYLQSRYLLGEETFRKTLEHELLHWTIKHHATFPLWFEEGIVCLITEELTGYKGIPAMKEVENVEVTTLENPWEMISFSLGCVNKVKEIMNIETEDF